MNPIEASMLTDSLSKLMDRLSVLDLHPVENGADIESLREDAELLTRDLLAYLITSDNFAPVVESADAVQEWEL